VTLLALHSAASAHCVVSLHQIIITSHGGKVVWGKYAQVTNNPENDGCINAVLLV
jgi:ribosome biogenesis protein NSA2